MRQVSEGSHGPKKVAYAVAWYWRPWWKFPLMNLAAALVALVVVLLAR